MVNDTNEKGINMYTNTRTKRIHKIFYYVCLFACIFCFLPMLSSCKAKEKKEYPLELKQIQNICELSTLECYYHNVAKSQKSKGKGLTSLGEVDRKFWIEYDGTVKIGIDFSKVHMQLKNDTVQITMPKPKLLHCSINEQTLNENSYISSKDGIFNKNKITVDDQTQAIKAAQENMKKQVMENQTLLLTAQKRAEKLISNYINQVGTMSEKTYQIKWKYSDEA